MLGNIWLRLASSPHHWIKVNAGSHGGNHNFTEQVIRRRTELIFDQEYLLVPDLKPETTKALAKDIMAASNLEGFAHGVVEIGDDAQLVIKDNETDFIYLKKALKAPGQELKAKSLSSTSVWPRGDPRNEALVFNIEYEEVNTSEEQLRQTNDFLNHAEFVCEGTVEPGQKLTGRAFRQNGSSQFVCLLDLRKYAAPVVNFNFTLKLNSGFRTTDFAILNRNSSSILHVALSEEHPLKPV